MRRRREGQIARPLPWRERLDDSGPQTLHIPPVEGARDGLHEHLPDALFPLRALERCPESVDRADIAAYAVEAQEVTPRVPRAVVGPGERREHAAPEVG